MLYQYIFFRRTYQIIKLLTYYSTMNYIKKFEHLGELVKNDVYVYKKGHRNVLFVGGCRSYCYATYFEEICKYVPWFKHAQFGISVIGVHVIDLLKRKKTKNIVHVIENADIIICEQIRNYSFLNTSKKCDQNIFNNFNIKPDCSIVQVPNMELRYYYHELTFENSNDANDNNKIKLIKDTNVNKIVECCKKYNFDSLGEYILRNINDRRLFVQLNHPCSHTVVEVVKLIIKNGFNQELLPPILNILRHIRIFESGPNSPISSKDYEVGLNRTVL